MANLGYIQVVRHCNHFCGFCSNPTTPYVHTFETMKELVDDFVERGYYGIILTGGEPTLHPELPKICAYARDVGLHVRMISNGHRLADPKFAQQMGEAGLQIVHISIYSIRPEVEEVLRGMPNTLTRALKALDNCHDNGIDININSVINKQNADHLDENIAYYIEHHPYIRHFVWNNLDPSMGRAEVNQNQYMHRLKDSEASLYRALKLLHDSGRTFRVEKMPLCYLTEYPWASTETRKIVKGEERIVHFLDAKQTVRQTRWGHHFSDACSVCSVREICGGLFDRGGGYDPAELYPIFLDRDEIARQIIYDGTDPSWSSRPFSEWKDAFEERLEEARDHAHRDDSHDEPEGTDGHPTLEPNTDGSVGFVDEKGLRIFEKRRKAEGKMANRHGVSMEKTEVALGDPIQGA
jgi:MoaA/NifB/PqqE/SkfB family radical SAM enzyme